MKTALGFTFAIVMAIALWFGYSVSMGEHGFFIQGYIGTAIPAVLVVMGALFGSALSS